MALPGFLSDAIIASAKTALRRAHGTAAPPDGAIVLRFPSELPLPGVPPYEQPAAPPSMVSVSLQCRKNVGKTNSTITAAGELIEVDLAIYVDMVEMTEKGLDTTIEGLDYLTKALVDFHGGTYRIQKAEPNVYFFDGLPLFCKLSLVRLGGGVR